MTRNTALGKKSIGLVLATCYSTLPSTVGSSEQAHGMRSVLPLTSCRKGALGHSGCFQFLVSLLMGTESGENPVDFPSCPLTLGPTTCMSHSCQGLLFFLKQVGIRNHFKEVEDHSKF